VEPSNVRTKILDQIQHMLQHTIIKDRRFLDDEQLIRSEQLAVLEAIFNANVRDTEIRELGSHFAPILRGDHPVHLAVWGKTGTGKTLTILYFLALLQDMCRSKGIGMRHAHLDLSTPRPCFRALNDLACLLNASKRYRKGISLEDLMTRMETRLADYQGYLVLFIDEVDNVRRDRDTFMTFLVRRLPQRVQAKLVLVFASNRLDWPVHLDPRVKSFLKLNELIFEPYDAVDLQHILRIRVRKALLPGALKQGVIEKIAAMASRDHGDARQAVGLLAKSAYLAEKAGTSIGLELVDEAATELDRDRYLALIRSAPSQLRAAMAAVIAATHTAKGAPVGTGDALDAYRVFCEGVSLRPHSGRAFADLLAELDMYSLVRTRVLSRGRYGRTREITLDLPDDLVDRIQSAIALSFDGGA
jgi:cell division control protein 6